MNHKKLFYAFAIVLMLGLAAPNDCFAIYCGNCPDPSTPPPDIETGGDNNVNVPLDGGITALVLGAGFIFSAYKKKKAMEA